MIYRISSHSSARFSSVHGTEHLSMGDALRALDNLADHSLTAVECGDEWMVYQTEDDADADTDGRAPHLAIARITTARSDLETT